LNTRRYLTGREVEQHWRSLHSRSGFPQMIVCENRGHASGLPYDCF